MFFFKLVLVLTQYHSPRMVATQRNITTLINAKNLITIHRWYVCIAAFIDCYLLTGLAAAATASVYISACFHHAMV
jgi:hypothetical protein